MKVLIYDAGWSLGVGFPESMQDKDQERDQWTRGPTQDYVCFDPVLCFF